MGVASANDHREDPAGTKAQEIEALRDSAWAALHRGDWAAARRDFEAVLQRRPGDGEAQREAARAAQAAGDFEYAVAALERAHHFTGHVRDAEVHYLRGEALYALGRTDEARMEHRIAQLEIGRAPLERFPRLWLARIHARLGQTAKADAIYEALWPAPGQAADAEVALNHAEAHTLVGDWAGAERILRRFLAVAPENRRARAMLAWALEAKGDLAEELVVRRKLAAEEGATASEQKDYGRALERAGDYGRARAAYETAASLRGAEDDPMLRGALERMHYLTAPELAAAMMARSDPAAESLVWQAGAAVPFASRHHAMLAAWHEASRGGFPVATGSTTGLGAAVVVAPPWGGSVALGGGARYTGQVTAANIPVRPARGGEVGGFAAVELPLGPHVQIDLRGDRNNAWSESAITTQEGGALDGVTGHLFGYLLGRRLILDGGAQARRLTLTARAAGLPEPRAEQLLVFAGADAVMWHDPARALRGETLDDQLLRRSALADAVVLSYRHYELYTRADRDFLSRIGLAQRSSINSGTLVIRKALAGGRIGIDARGGLGYDPERGRRLLYQGGGSLLLVPRGPSRITISYDQAAETTTGLSGRRHMAWLSYHTDL